MRLDVGALHSRRSVHLPARTTGATCRAAVVGLLLVASTTACATAGPAGRADAGRTTLRLGYSPNVTHAPALVGIRSGRFAAALGPGVALEPVTFNAGPAAVEALFAGSVDVAFIGPSPAVNAFEKSGGAAIRVVAGSTSGGASLVVRDGIDGPDDLRGTTLATPQIGGTQDVALRSWIRRHHLRADVDGGGDVSIVSQSNPSTLDSFRRGQIDGAWVPEPWATRLVRQGGAKVLVDERSLWRGGRWATTVVVVRTQFLREHRAEVAALLTGLVATVDSLRSDPAAARATTGRQIEAVTGKQIPAAVLDAAWQHLDFTVDPLMGSLRRMAADATSVGLLDRIDLRGIDDLGPLDDVLARAGRAPVEDR